MTTVNTKDLKRKKLLRIVSTIAIVASITFLVLVSIFNNRIVWLGRNVVYTDSSVATIYNLLKNRGINFNTSDSTEQKLMLEDLSIKRIRDIPDLDIEVNTDENTIHIESDAENIEQVYQALLKNVYYNGSKFSCLLKQFEAGYGSEHKLNNIEKEVDGSGNLTGLMLKAPEGVGIDVRVLDMPVEVSEGQSSYIQDEGAKQIEALEQEIDKENGLDLINHKQSVEDVEMNSADGYGEGIEYKEPKAWLFKPEAVWAQATSTVGEEALDKVRDNRGLIFRASSSELDDIGVYQVIQVEDVVDSIRVNEQVHNNVSKAKPVYIEPNIITGNYIRVYFGDNQFTGVITELLQYLGYQVEVSEDQLDCDLVIGYTWIYYRGITSSLNDTLNEAVASYSLTGDMNNKVEFLLRSAWGITDK